MTELTGVLMIADLADIKPTNARDSFLYKTNRTEQFEEFNRFEQFSDEVQE